MGNGDGSAMEKLGPQGSKGKKDLVSFLILEAFAIA
jgi:hypothetical protein